MGSSDSKDAKWSDSLQLGEYTLKNRVVMASMSRLRCDPKTGVPTELLAKYYGQRAGAGLVLTEAASWSQRGVAYPGSGELYNQAQADGWKKVTDEVHKKDGKIYV
jgi:N-ethylmaleimide reductase